MHSIHSAITTLKECESLVLLLSLSLPLSPSRLSPEVRIKSGPAASMHPTLALVPASSWRPTPTHCSRSPKYACALVYWLSSLPHTPPEGPKSPSLWPVLSREWHKRSGQNKRLIWKLTERSCVTGFTCTSVKWNKLIKKTKFILY